MVFFLFVCFFTNPSSAIPKVDLLIQCLSSSSHGATECILQNDTLPRQLQKTMCTLMSFRLSNTMHHLQQNKTALQKRRGSALALAVLFWMDEIVLKANIDSHYSPPEIRPEFPWNAMVQFPKSDFSIQIIYISFGLTQYVSALQMECSMVGQLGDDDIGIVSQRTTTLLTSWIACILKKYAFHYWVQCVM